MQKQDSRVNTTTESLNNIKMLKLYSWTQYFEDKIREKRDIELGVQWKKIMYSLVMVTSFFFFP
jgi:hypothetical protein